MHQRREAADRSRTLLGAAVILFSVSAAHAQLNLQPNQPGGPSDLFLQRQRQIEEENRARLDRVLPPSQKVLFDWGGWFDWYTFLFDDGFDSSRTQRSYTLRLWGAMTAEQGTHDAYVRMRTAVIDWNGGDAFTGRDDDYVSPRLERGWYQLDVTKALKRYADVTLPLSLKTKIGRDFVQAGTGYAISLPLDHVQVRGEALGLETTFVVGRTPSSTQNIDRSRPVAGESNRTFWIIETKYRGFRQHEPFAYVAINRDHTREDPVDLLQNYQYDSTYVGFGSTGELVRNLRYASEWVIERGQSYGDRRFLYTDEIKAWAFDQVLEYLFDHKTKPRLSGEYMFASGDPDRLGSPTNAAGGNRGDRVDNGFIGFGFRDTGLTFAPRLSNIHIWRIGASFLPLPDVELLKALELGTNWFLYYKHRSDAASSDPLADEQSGYLGWEMDYFVNYRITSDLSITVRFGTFFPGSAFSDQTTRTFLLTGVTWSF